MILNLISIFLFIFFLLIKYIWIILPWACKSGSTAANNSESEMSCWLAVVIVLPIALYLRGVRFGVLGGPSDGPNQAGKGLVRSMEWPFFCNASTPNTQSPCSTHNPLTNHRVQTCRCELVVVTRLPKWTHQPIPP